MFRDALVGPGVAIDPYAADRVVTRAPVAGRVATVHPHAAVVVTSDGTGVLVHLGIDTVQLHGDGFDVHVARGDEVAAGDPLVTWSPRAVVAGGRSALCPVVVLDVPAGAVEVLAAPGSHVVAGDPLLEVRGPGGAPGGGARRQGPTRETVTGAAG